MTKYVIVWNDETEGTTGVTGTYESPWDAIKVIRDYIDDLFSADGPEIWNEVDWAGGWKIECNVGEVLFAEIHTLDSAAFS